MMENIRTRQCAPKQRISATPALTQAQRHRVLIDWNQSDVKFDDQRLLHEWIEAQVETSPHAPAVTFEGSHLTYIQLNRRANQLAHFLRRTGVGPEVLVGLYLERSLEMVVGLLAILKAGGAYVPIDPEYPSERVAFMLEDANPSVLLIQGRFKSSVPEYHGAILCIDDDWEQIAGEDTSNLPRQATPDNLAYVIYTSGSTGTPKGAMNNHRGICNRLLWGQSHFQLAASDTVLQKTPFSFDVSVWEFFWPLLAGARLVLAKPQGHRDPDYLANLIVAEQVTVCHFVPSMLATFLAHRGAARCQCLRHVICSGEALPFSLQERFFSLLPAHLHNLYGPTETAVEVTYWQCERNANRNIVPIGRPIANTRAYILDADLEPVPTGMPGELYIGGVQVGRGYLNHPEQTAERFIPDLFDSDPKARMYGTGDICRWLEDGNIEYLGRTDSQVKIRGHRIELGEIEAKLHGHPNVLSACVAPKEDAVNGRYLVAFVVRSKEDSPTLEQLREFLLTKLPIHMLPSRFAFLEQLPLLPNGKIDRKALGRWSAPRRERTVAASSDPIEQRLMEIWRSLLGIESIGTDEDFFDLGGDSLLAALLLTEIEREFDVRLSLSSIFEAPRIDTLGRIIKRDRTSGLQIAHPVETACPTLVPIQPKGCNPPMFCISGVGGGVFVFRVLARHLGPDQPIYGLQPLEPDGEQPVAMTVPEIARNYIREMRAAQPNGPYFLAGFSFGGLVAFEIACQLRSQGQRIGLLAIFDTDLSTHLNRSPFLTRVQNRLKVYGVHLNRLLAESNRASYLMKTIRGWGTKPIYRMYKRLGRPVPGRVASFGTIEDVQTFAADSYAPAVYDGRVTLFRCSAWPVSETGYDLGWAEVADGGLDICEVPGDHHSMWVEPNIRVLVSRLRDRLDHADLFRSVAHSPICGARGALTNSA